MDTLIDALSHILVLLFIVGAAGCFLVIPWTAVELVKAMLDPDSDEADGTSEPRAVS